MFLHRRATGPSSINTSLMTLSSYSNILDKVYQLKKTLNFKVLSLFQVALIPSVTVLGNQIVFEDRRVHVSELKPFSLRAPSEIVWTPLTHVGLVVGT